MWFNLEGTTTAETTSKSHYDEWELQSFALSQTLAYKYTLIS